MRENEENYLTAAAAKKKLMSQAMNVRRGSGQKGGTHTKQSGSRWRRRMGRVESWNKNIPKYTSIESTTHNDDVVSTEREGKKNLMKYNKISNIYALLENWTLSIENEALRLFPFLMRIFHRHSVFLLFSAVERRSRCWWHSKMRGMRKKKANEKMFGEVFNF